MKEFFGRFENGAWVEGTHSRTLIRSEKRSGKDRVVREITHVLSPENKWTETPDNPFPEWKTLLPKLKTNQAGYSWSLRNIHNL